MGLGTWFILANLRVPTFTFSCFFVGYIANRWDVLEVWVPQLCWIEKNRLPDISQAKMGIFGSSRELQFGVCNHGKPCESPHISRERECFSWHREGKEVVRTIVNKVSVTFHWKLLTVTESKLILLTTWQANKSGNELLGQRITTLIKKLADQEDGILVSQKTISQSKFRLFLNWERGWGGANSHSLTVTWLGEGLTTVLRNGQAGPLKVTH